MFRVECFLEGVWKPQIDTDSRLVVYYTNTLAAERTVEIFKNLLAKHQMPAYNFRIVQH